MKDPVRKITHKDGSVRYRLVVDIGVDAAGKREQLTRTFKTKKEALAELSRIRNELSTGTFVAPSKMTLNDLLDIWLKSATRDVEEGTASNYESAMVPVRTHSGDKELQSASPRRTSNLLSTGCSPAADGAADGPEPDSASGPYGSPWAVFAPR